MGWLEWTVVGLVIATIAAWVIIAQWRRWQGLNLLFGGLVSFGGLIAVMLVLMILRGEGCI